MGCHRAMDAPRDPTLRRADAPRVRRSKDKSLHNSDEHLPAGFHPCRLPLLLRASPRLASPRCDVLHSAFGCAVFPYAVLCATIRHAILRYAILRYARNAPCCVCTLRCDTLAISYAAMRYAMLYMCDNVAGMPRYTVYATAVAYCDTLRSRHDMPRHAYDTTC